MNILVDSAMPYWAELFNPLAHVETYIASELESIVRGNDDDGRAYSRKLQSYLSTVDCLLVRSTTKVNQDLLEKMPKLSFVATATAGFDHLDLEAIKNAGIKWYVAGGCNAQAVAQYVVCALLHLAVEDSFVIEDKVVGIVGNGNVGSRVATAMRALGANVVVYDPPQQAQMQKLKDNSDLPYYALEEEALPQYVEFSEILRADIICIHAPLNSHPEHPTKHLFNSTTLSTLHGNQYLINAGRGEIIDNDALLTYFSNKIDDGQRSLNVVLDVWENEPEIMTHLLPNLRLASAHIAGHTLEGKANGTFMLYQQVCKQFDYPQTLSLDALLPQYDPLLSSSLINALSQGNNLESLQLQSLVKEICHFVYDIRNDDRVFRLHMAQFKSFAKLRKEYPIRREFSALSLKVSSTQISELLRAIGFTVYNDR